MTYAFVQEVPADAEMYAKIDARIRASLPAGTTTPAGLISHVVIQREAGLRYVDVWSSRQDWDRFREEHVEPSVEAVLAEYGIPHDHSLVTVDEVEVIATWLGEPVNA